MSGLPVTLTMQDIADLAGVRRPVVSMWRRRRSVHGEQVPFPEPVAVVGGVERFDPGAVGDYLLRTGRGKNRDHVLDAPAVAVPLGLDLEDLVTLLCWHVMTGAELTGTSRPDRAEAARQVDAADRLLLREIRALEATAEALAYVDDLIEASFGPQDALARLESGRLAREGAARDLSASAVDLLGRLVAACADQVGAGGLTLSHPDDAGLGRALSGSVAGVVVSGDTPQERGLRRRAVIRGQGAGGDDAVPRVSLCSLIGLVTGEALDRLDEVILNLSADDVAVVVGPASLLCDTLRGDDERRRAQTLRSRTLALALRLPRGLWREAHRQSLAVWICRGGGEIRAPRVADLSALGIGQRLGAGRLGAGQQRGIGQQRDGRQLDVEDLVVDLVAALDQSDARSYRYARQGELSRMLAGGPVVPRGARAVRWGSTADATHLDRVHAATLETSRPLEPLDVVVAPASIAVTLRHRSLAELQAAGHLTMRRGSRIDVSHVDPAGTVVVLPDVGGPRVRLDAFDAARLYPRVYRTEPGDVVFVEKPRPRAWVDLHGGALVASPARVLRLAPTAGLGPWTLANVINHLVVEGTEWPTWTVPDLPREEIHRLEEALAAVDRFDAEARRRCDAATTLKKALIEGVAAGALTLLADHADHVEAVAPLPELVPVLMPPQEES